MEINGFQNGTPLMNLRQIKACGHLLLGTLQFRCEHHGNNEDPRQEMVTARVFIKKRLKELPETDDKNDKNFVLRSLYKIIDKNYATIFNKIGQVSGELAYLSTIHSNPEFEDVELQFIWTCDYLFQSGQLEDSWRADFIVPNTPEFEMPEVDDLGVDEQIEFELESENELRRQLEGCLAIEEGKSLSSQKQLEAP
uniref:Uncharacterized protein n=1 Tax=Caenorhabditis japonica TaxID=281687 RepID=A0A8R1DUF7_CAEJA